MKPRGKFLTEVVDEAPETVPALNKSLHKTIQKVSLDLTTCGSTRPLPR